MPLESFNLNPIKVHLYCVSQTLTVTIGHWTQKLPLCITLRSFWSLDKL